MTVGHGQSLWHVRDFRTFMLGETVSEFGGTVGSFALPLAVLIATGSALHAGLTSASAVAGSILCSVVAGAWVDSHSRRNVMSWTVAVRVLTWTTMGVCLSTKGFQLQVFIPVAFLGGAASALFNSAQAGALKEIVAPQDFPRAVAAIDGRNAAADLAGAPVGGVLIGFGAYVPALFNALSFLASFVAIRLIRADLGTPSLPDLRTVMQRVGDGYRYVWSRVEYRSLVSQAILSNFGNIAFTFALILILQQDRQPTWAIGLVTTGTAASGLIGALLAGRIVARYRIATIITAAESLRFTTLIAVIVWHDNMITCIALTAAGFILTPAANAAERAYMSITTPGHLQGRVASFDQLVGSSLAPLAPLAAGILITAVAPTAALATFTAMVGLAVVVTLTSRATRRLPYISAITEQS